LDVFAFGVLVFEFSGVIAVFEVLASAEAGQGRTNQAIVIIVTAVSVVAYPLVSRKLLNHLLIVNFAQFCALD